MRIFLLFCCICMVAAAQAQVKNPVHWTFSAKKLGATMYEIHLVATIDEGWHTYSQSTPAGGPVPTTIQFSPNPLVDLMGVPVEKGKLQQHFEKLFGVDVKQFDGKIDFVQKITLKKAIQTNVSGKINFMVCNDKECLPPTDQSFSVTLP